MGDASVATMTGVCLVHHSVANVDYDIPAQDLGASICFFFSNVLCLESSLLQSTDLIVFDGAVLVVYVVVVGTVSDGRVLVFVGVAYCS